MPANFPKTLMPHPFPTQKTRRASTYSFGPVLFAALFVAIGLFSLPSLLATDLSLADAKPVKAPFPVTVDPANQTIVEDPRVDALLEEATKPTSLSAAAGNAQGVLAWLANLVASVPGYDTLAGSDVAFVTISPGYRQEQVASAFGAELGWSSAEQKAFLKQVHAEKPVLSEGSFVPGTYMVSAAASPKYVQNILNDRFQKEIVARYSTSTEERVPLDQALTIASMLERETRDPAEMRLISGIIWNRLWQGMNLQIDATLQYAKTSTAPGKSWWPAVVPKDKFVKSPYNTYAHAGLPPGPIANPSIAAVLAALNPKKTDCLFYFHDTHGVMHCTATYAEHVALLKKYYGQGK